MSYFKNDVHLLFLPIPYTGWEPVHDFLCQHYQEPVIMKGTYEDMFEQLEDHLLLYMVRNPYERMICYLFSLGKIKKTSTKEEVYAALEFCPTQFSYVSRNNQLVHAKVLHAETLNQDMKALGYEFQVESETLPYMNYFNDKSLDAIHTFYEKDFDMFHYEKKALVAKRYHEPIPLPYLKPESVVFTATFGTGLPPYVDGNVVCDFSPYESTTVAIQRMLDGVVISNQRWKPTHISMTCEIEPIGELPVILCAWIDGKPYHWVPSVIPNPLRLYEPYTLPPGTYHIQNNKIAEVVNGVLYPKKIGTTYLYGKDRITIMVVRHPRFSFALTT